jgi:ribosomal protein S18 acetylase RimI-like enzyme
MIAGCTLSRLDVEEARSRLDELVSVYVDVYADVDDGEGFFGEDRYRRQLAGHMAAPGWELVAAHIDGVTVGYIYGFALPADTRWWRGLLTEVPPDFRAEDGGRTVAISELLVRAPWRRRGIARALHDEFLAGRRESRATLLVEPDNVPAQAAYAHWGWHKVAQLRPSWDGAPLYDVLVRPLSGSGGVRVTSGVRRDEVLGLLREVDLALDDDDIAGRLGMNRHYVNAVCRRLAEDGFIRRLRGPAGKFVNSAVDERGH